MYENVDENDIFLTISNPPYIANDYKLPENVKYEPSNALLVEWLGWTFKDIINKQMIKKFLIYFVKWDLTKKAPLENYFKEF